MEENQNTNTFSIARRRKGLFGFPIGVRWEMEEQKRPPRRAAAVCRDGGANQASSEKNLMVRTIWEV